MLKRHQKLVIKLMFSCFSLPRALYSFLLVFCVFYNQAQTGPYGVGQNVASANQVRFWLKADAGVFNNAGTTPAANGDRVQQWNDQSGVGNNSAQATLARRPVYATNMVNGLPALRFLGGQYVTAGALPGIANNVGYTYSIVFRDTAFTAGAMNDGAGDYIIDRGAPSPEGNELSSLKIVSTNRYGFQKRDGGGGGLGGPVGTSIINTAYHVLNYRQIPGANKTYQLFYDNVSEASVVSADANYTPQTPQIGHHYQPASGGLKGYIAEVIIYNYAVNAAQMNILNSSLAARYGLTLAANDKYVGDNGGNGDYDFEVAGIGFETGASNLSAASSVSGGLEATQNTVMEAGEYLLLGHQTGANAVIGTDVGGMSAGPNRARWSRIWYLDWTHIGGTNETVNLIFDYSDGGVGGSPVAPLSNYKLLYRAGLAGAWTEVMNASSIAGDRVTFTGVVYSTVGDGYYTIGTLDAATSPLPLTLITFNGEPCGNEICLNWSTANEVDTKLFIVQKSADGESWTDIAERPAAGQSTTFKNYEAIDPEPHSNTNYYRLKQIDLDQTYSFSKIISVYKNQSSNMILAIYPNPNNGAFSVQVSGIVSGKKIKIHIYDPMGKLCYSTEHLVENSRIEHIQIEPGTKLTAGTYECVLNYDNAQESCKLIVE